MKLKKTWRLWKEMIIYRKSFSVWVRMQITQNNTKKPTPRKLFFNKRRRENGFYNFFSVINFTFKLFIRYCCVFHFVFCYWTLVLFLFFNFEYISVCACVCMCICVYMYVCLWCMYMCIYMCVYIYINK